MISLEIQTQFSQLDEHIKEGTMFRKYLLILRVIATLFTAPCAGYIQLH